MELGKIWWNIGEREFSADSGYRIRFFIAFTVLELLDDLLTSFFWPRFDQKWQLYGWITRERWVQKILCQFFGKILKISHHFFYPTPMAIDYIRCDLIGENTNVMNFIGCVLSAFEADFFFVRCQHPAPAWKFEFPKFWSATLVWYLFRKIKTCWSKMKKK